MGHRISLLCDCIDEDMDGVKAELWDVVEVVDDMDVLD